MRKHAYEELPLWLIRLDRGLRSNDVEAVAEAVASLRNLGIYVRVDLSGNHGRTRQKHEQRSESLLEAAS